MNVTNETHEPGGYRVAGVIRRVSWGAIIAGLFVTLIIQMILTLLGTAIGAAVVDPMSRNPAEGLGTGAAIWIVVTGLISLFAGAWVAGRLSGGPRRMDGLLHGVVTFSVAEVVMILLITTSLGAVIGGAGTLISRNTDTSMGRQLERQFEQLMPQGGTGGPESQAAQGAVGSAEEQELRQTADQAASGLSKGALWAFIGMVLGLAVAAWGGWAGTASLPRYHEEIVTTAA